MYLNGFLTGVAHSEHEAQTTLNELMDEIALHTRATTADMEAEMAAFQLEEAGA